MIDTENKTYDIAQAAAAGTIIDVISLLIEESQFTDPENFVGVTYTPAPAEFFTHTQGQLDKIAAWVDATSEALSIAEEIIEDAAL